MKSIGFALALAALTVAGAAEAQTPGPRFGERADLLLQGSRKIMAFAVNADGLGIYLQDGRRDWYYASFYPGCYKTRLTPNIGFVPFAGGNRLISGDMIIFGGLGCVIKDLSIAARRRGGRSACSVRMTEPDQTGGAVPGRRHGRTIRCQGTDRYGRVLHPAYSFGGLGAGDKGPRRKIRC